MTWQATFHYRAGQLYCDDVSLETIAAEAGTPVYVYSARGIQRNVETLRAAFADVDCTIHYSLKANANLTLIRHLRDLGIGMDAVSGGEIFRALRAGVTPADIVFAGVGKTHQEIDYALQVGIGWFNVESRGELELLNRLAGEQGKRPNVALRLNPAVQADTHQHIATGHSQAKFGLDAATIADVLKHQTDYSHVTFGGLHIHIGSQLGSVNQTRTAIEHAQALMEPYPHLRTLNIGGGFPVNYAPEDNYPPPAEFASMIKLLVAGWQVKIEPGRSIVASAGALVITSLYTKQRGTQPLVITDGSMTELLRPALYDAYHPIIPLQQSAAPLEKTVVAGPVCESADVLGNGILLPPLAVADRLAVLMAGAYGFVMASTYNQRPRPPEIWVEGANWRVVRRRETWDDLISLEQSAN